MRLITGCRLSRVAAGAVLAWLVAGSAVRGDVFLLKNDGRVEGEWVNREDLTARELIIRTELGDVSIPKAQLKQRVAAKPALVEYEKTAVTYPDTVEGHWQLAEWCKKNLLTELSKSHLRRVVELDPHHEQARRRLGYYKEDGQWLTDEERLRKKGLVRVNGKEMTVAELKLHEEQRRFQSVELTWFKKLDQWRKQLDKADQAPAARAELLAITDSAAVKPLIVRLEREKKLDIRLIYLQALAKTKTAEALGALVKYSLEDENEEIRTMCYELLGRYSREKGELRPKIVNNYVAALKAKENEQVQRAAIGLRYVQDSDKSAIGPLIDALVTEHVYIIMPRNPGNVTGSFDKSGRGNNGLGGLSVGGKPRREKRTIMNHDVLSTLVSLTGVDHSFDEKAWTRWYASQRRGPATGDTRRD